MTAGADSERVNASARRRRWVLGLAGAVVGVGALSALVAWYVAVFVVRACPISSDHVPRVVRAAALQWQLGQSTGGACPTYRALADERILDPEFEKSYPAATIRIQCPAEDIVVSWAGRDAVFGTSDDVVARDPGEPVVEPDDPFSGE